MPPLRTLLLVLLLVVPLAARPETLNEFARRRSGPAKYCGIYVMGKKIGWLSRGMRVDHYKGQPVALVEEKLVLKTNRSGEKTEINKTETLYFELSGQGQIVAAEIRELRPGGESLLKAERRGGKLLIKETAAGLAQERQVELPHESLRLLQNEEAWLKTARPGAVFQNYSLSWEREPLESTGRITFKRRGQGPPTPTYLVSMEEQGMRMEGELTSDSRPIQLKVGGGMEFRSEPALVAKRLDGAGNLDVSLMIPVMTNLGEARQVGRLVLEATGCEDFKFPLSGRQRVRREGKRTVLTLLQDGLDSTPLNPKQQKEYLSATPSIQIGPEIRERARSIVGKETSALGKARKLATWTHVTLKKSYEKNAATTHEILVNMAGDCTEHTLLFVSLARACDVPARIVGGLAYASLGPDNSKTAFAWHAWAEFHDGRGWVAVDPTWGEVPADATHIKMQTSDDDLQWINLLGKLKLTVLDFGKQ